MMNLVYRIRFCTTNQLFLALTRVLLLSCLCFSLVSPVFAATKTATVSGTWNTNTPWGGTPPANGDVVIINTGVQVTITANTNTINSVTLNGTLILVNGNLAMATGITTAALTISGTGRIQFDGTGVVTGGGNNGNGLTVTINSGATLSSKNATGFMAQSGGNTVNTGCFAINRGNKTSPAYNAGANYIFNNAANQNTGTGVTTAANITIANTAGQVTTTANIAASGTISVNAGANLNLAATTLTLSGAGTPLSVTGTFTRGTSTVVYSGTSAQVIKDVDYNNLSLSNSGAKSITAGDSVVVNGTLNAAGSAVFTLNGNADLTVIGTFNGSQALTMNTGTLSLGGATTNAFANTGTFTANTGTVNYFAAGNQTMRGTTYNNVVFSGSGAKTTTGATINGTLSIQGTATAAGTVPTYGTSALIEYKGSAAQTTGIELPNTGLTAAGIVINNANGVTMNAAKNLGTKSITIGSTVANSILKDSIYTITATGSINCVSGTFRLGATATATTYPAFSSSTWAAGCLVQYASGAAQAVSTTPAYANLVLSGNGTKTTAAGTLTIAGNWTLAGGTAAMNTNNTSASVTGDILGSATMTLGSGTISITGDFSHTGTFTANTSTVNYRSASGGQTVKGASYNTLTMSNSSGTQVAAGAVTANNFNTVAGGSLDMVTFALSVTNVNHLGTLLTQHTGTTPIPTGKTWGGTVNYNSGSGQNIVFGNYNDLAASGGAKTLSTTGTIGIAGTFTPGNASFNVLNSTVDFNGSGNQNMPTFTFHNLIVSNAGIKKIPASITVACQNINIEDNASVEINADGGGKLAVLE